MIYWRVKGLLTLALVRQFNKKYNIVITLEKNASAVSRVVILGAKGFVGSAINRRLRKDGITVLPLSHSDVDLTDDDAGTRLGEILNPQDTLFFVSAKAPVKNEQMLIDNIKMAKAVCDALQKVQVAHLVYISSDAVYADSDYPLKESSCAQPGSLHGIMHLAREVMLANIYNGSLCVLRPTLIYGKGDPHNGYGPNRFIRLSKEGKNIELFGEGEERRDHVWINDVAEIARLIILSRAAGILNIVSGETVSFRDIAEKAVSHASNTSKILGTVRIGPMPHNGYRAFDNTATKKNFPDFQYHSLFTIMETMNNEDW